MPSTLPEGESPPVDGGLPEAARASVAAAYTAALTPLFGYLVPLLLISLVVLCLVRPVPLATTLADDPVSAGDESDTEVRSLETSSREARRAVDHSHA